MSKRGAVSILIIIAILILLLIGFIVFMRSHAVPEVPTDFSSGYDASDVEESINRCLSQSIVRGIVLIGQQGGAIYQSQGGTTPLSDYTSLPFDERDIYKGIRAGDQQPGKSCIPTHSKVVYNPQNCPSLAFPFTGTASSQISFEKKWFPAPPINWKERLRMFNKFSLPSIYPEEDIFTQMVSTYDYARGARGNFVFEDLKAFVEYDIDDCLSDVITALNDTGLEITHTGGISVEPVIGDAGVSATLNFPILVSNNGKSLFEMTEFFASTKVRLKKVYETAWELLKNEAEDFSYDLSRRSVPSGMSYTLLPADAAHYLLVINDSMSDVPNNGIMTSFVFTSAIEKSQPAISYIHYENLNAVPRLHNNIIHCPQYPSPRDNPFEETGNSLTVEIGTTLTRKSIECIWKAYETSLNNPLWKNAYDPDNDPLNWSFKTALCDWNKPCQYKGDNLYFDGNHFGENYITLKFTDGVYEDVLNMSLSMHNHAPEIIAAIPVPIEDVLKDYIGELGADAAGALIDVAGFKAYIFIAEDVDMYWGDEVDDLTYAVTPSPMRTWEEEGDVEDQKGWGVLWQRPGGFEATFTVTDKYGATASETVYVN